MLHLTGLCLLLTIGSALSLDRIGCFKDASNRDLPHLITWSSDASPEKCVDYCGTKGYKFAGVQNGKQCFCGNSYGKHGAVPKADCNKKCVGNTHFTCGASWRNDIYKTELNGHIGCFTDKADRDLPHLFTFAGANNPAKCVNFCSGKGYKYAGVQNGSQCFCGDSYGKHGMIPQGECNKPCSGNTSQKCGASWKNDIYRTRNAAGCCK